MRFILALIGLAAVVVVALLATGMMTLSSRPGALPSLHVDGGKAPEFKADVAKVSLGMENKQVDVPTVTTTSKTISVPHFSVTKPTPTPAP